MPLKLFPLCLEDFDQIINHANIYEPGDDLIAPPNPIAWPVSSRQEAQTRLQFTMAKQRRRFQEDKSVRFMKIVEAPSEGQEDDDIISVARWHYYPTGYSYATMAHWEMAECLPGKSWPEGFKHELHDFILAMSDVARKDWIGQGRPVWILMHMVTRRSQRGRGAAGMLIRWGIEQSEKDGVPAYLEAGAQGRPVYEKYGSEQVGELVPLDLRPYGVDMVFELAKMVRFPKQWKEKNRAAPK